MEKCQKRVIAEKVDLDDKITKLITFTNTEKFQKDLGWDERCYLTKQISIMWQYSVILGDRINEFYTN